MNNQGYIKRLCLIGSDRQPIDPNKLPEPIVDIMGDMTGTDSAEIALHALALDHYYQLAGSNLPKLSKVINISPIEEAAAYAPEEYYDILLEIIEVDKLGLKSLLLTKWIERLCTRKTIVHPMYLVKYLNALLDATKEMRLMAIPTLGKKGIWLCSHNVKYEKIIDKAEDDIWSFGTAAQRDTFMVRLLTVDPDKAITLLEENWATENAREKLRHLNLLLDNVHPSQLSFIESLYDGEFIYKKNETVTQRRSRNSIAKILLLLPQSKLHKKTVAHLGKYVSIKKKGMLAKVFQHQTDILAIPEKEDDFFNDQIMLTLYGIDTQSTLASDYRTDPLYWFSELCGALPFHVWTDITGLQPKNVLSDFLNTDRYQNIAKGKKVSGLKQALIELAARYKNDDYTVMLLDQEKDKSTAFSLLPRLSKSAWEMYLMDDWGLIDRLILDNCPHKGSSWSMQFSRKILDHIINQLHDNVHPNDYSIGLTMAEYLHVDAMQHIMKLNNGKIQQGNLYPYWKKHIFDPIYQSLTIKKQIQNL